MNKNLINCETCGKEIAKKAKVCPYCGIKRSKRGILKTTLIVLIVFVALALVGALKHSDAQKGHDNVSNLISESISPPKCDTPEVQQAAIDASNVKMGFLGQLSEFNDAKQNGMVENDLRPCWAIVTIVIPTENVASTGSLLYWVDLDGRVEKTRYAEKSRFSAGIH